MSFFSLLKRNKESYSLVFNISSGSISGGIIRFSEEPGENLVYYAKEIIPFQQRVSINKHLSYMEATLASLAKKIQNEVLRKISGANKSASIDRIFYVFSSPWSISQTKTIRIKEPKAFKVSAEYLNHVIEEQERQFQIDIARVGEVIEKKIIQVKINGYAVTDFYNKVTQDIEISVFFTVVPKHILNTVENAVAHTFHPKNIWCHSLALASLTVIKNLFPQTDDFIQIDLGEEVTDIAIIDNNIITNSATIPLGRNHFIRRLSSLLNVSEEIANSMVKMHSEKSNDDLADLKLSVSIDTAARAWLQKIFIVLDSFKVKIYVPDIIFLISCNNDLINLLQAKLQKQDFKVLLPDNHKIKPPIVKDDTVFKITLMFLDNIYKI